jgi:Amt family ammonium transporter
VKAVLLTIGWTVVATAVIAKVVKVILGLRADKETEDMGLDQIEHGEVAYHFDEAGS